MRYRSAIAALTFFLAARTASAQQGYEFEVYGTDIGRKGSSGIELNTNYVANGLRAADEGLVPSNRALRMSFEFSNTLLGWLQSSLYLTSYAGPGRSLTYVGNRLRLTAIAPRAWKLPFDLGMAHEISYAQPGFSENRWAYELSPIIGKSFGPLSLTFNPAVERGLGKNSHREIELEPRGKIAYRAGDDAAIAVEYYAGLGGIGEGYPLSAQRHQLFTSIEAEVASRWEVKAGLGRGLTRSSDRWVLTTAIEYQLRR